MLGMPYLIMEAGHTMPVRLLDVWNENEIVSLRVQKLDTDKYFNLSWNMDYTGEYWLWSVADYQTLITISE